MCNIEELEKTIYEIELDKILVSYQIEERKKQRELRRKNEKQERLNILNKIKTFTICYALSSSLFHLCRNIETLRFFGSNNFVYRNLYRNNSIAISNDKVNDIRKELEQELDITIPFSDMDNYLLLNSIKNNKSLTLEQKKICYEMITVIENNPYIDKSIIYDSFANLNIFYTERPKYEEDYILGTYTYPGCKIEIYEDDDYNRTLRHELIHCIFFNRKTYFNLPTSFMEGMTELLSNEYFFKSLFEENQNYPFNTIYVKMLCEIVGSECVLEAYTTGNMNNIYDYMDNIYGKKGEAKTLLNRIDDIICEYKDGTEQIKKDDIEKLLSNLKNYYFNNEYLNLTEEDISIYNYYEDLIRCLSDKNPYDSYLLKTTLKRSTKSYFSNELQEYLDFGNSTFNKQKNKTLSYSINQ